MPPSTSSHWDSPLVECHDRVSPVLFCPIRQRLSRRIDAQSDRGGLGADLRRFLRQRRATHRRSIARPSTKWARCRCWCTGPESSPNPACILTYLADRTGEFQPAVSDSERLEALRWILFDNQKLEWFPWPVSIPPHPGQAARRPGGARFSQGPPRQQYRHSRQADSRQSLLCSARRPTIADLSLVAYLYYPAEEFGFDITAQYANIAAWLATDKGAAGMEAPL